MTRTSTNFRLAGSSTRRIRSRLLLLMLLLMGAGCTNDRYRHYEKPPGDGDVIANTSMNLDPRLLGALENHQGSEHIRINQLGYLPLAEKRFGFVVENDLERESSFTVVDRRGRSVYTGKTDVAQPHPLSGELLKVGSFTDLKTHGEGYRILIDEHRSYPFDIKDEVFGQAFIGSAKSFTLQRASMALTAKVAGIYARPASHLDTEVIIHPSTKPADPALVGRAVSSPGGWYDAGDFNKYIVNAAISSAQLMALSELHPNLLSDGEMTIPESGNGVSDLLDEVRYELEWMLTMQDSDGGVFHKLTTLKFEAMILAEQARATRYIVGKGTAATLDFAAAMAQAARVYRDIDPGFALDVLSASEGAWNWALANPAVIFKNPIDVKTGAYADEDFDHEFFWAASELFTTTGDEAYLTYVNRYYTPVQMRTGESWRLYLPNLGAYSLLHHAVVLPSDLEKKLLTQLDQTSKTILQGMEQSPYSTGIGSVGLGSFEWGSNSDVLNALIVLANARSLQTDAEVKGTYLQAIVTGIDYIYGRNGLGMSFVTGYGSKTPMRPHHRQSSADNIVEPVPGLLSGGPNPKMQDKKWVTYRYSEPMRSWEDAESSYSANEVCLNWNAPLVYVLGYVEANKHALR